MPGVSTTNVYDRNDPAIRSLLSNLVVNAPIHEITSTELARLLEGIASEAQVNDYIATSGQFYSPFRRSGKRWICIPATAVHEKDLYEPYMNLFKHVLNHFDVYNPDKRIIARASEEHGPGAHGPETVKIRDVPIISAMSISEDHFQPWDEASEDYNFECCATPVEIGVNGGKITKDEDERYLAQGALYADTIWRNQPGRRWVYVPIFTRSHVRLLLFDQAGVLRSAWFDIHKRPDILVRIILLTLSQSAVPLGAHPAFTGDKKKMFITVGGVKYETVSQIYDVPKGIADAVRVWIVVDEQKNQKVIKWSWTPDEGDPLETDTMELLKGMHGVVQMIARQQDYYMFEGRPVVPDGTFKGGSLAEILVVMELYGTSIDQFKTPMQFLCALRDAAAGLQAMWEVGVVHRDISYRNILLGQSNAPVGSRGVIIDMDRASLVPAGSKLPKANPHFGTLAFRSWDVVNSEKFPEDARVHHDYLEDLQSITWVFLWIITGTKAKLNRQGKRVAHHHPFKDALASDNLHHALHIRRTAIWKPETVKIDPSYPHQFDVLKTRLMNFFADRVLYYPKNPKNSTRESLAYRSKKDFSEYLALFDQAIDDLEKGVRRDVRDFGHVEDEYSMYSGDDDKDESTSVEVKEEEVVEALLAVPEQEPEVEGPVYAVEEVANILELYDEAIEKLETGETRETGDQEDTVVPVEMGPQAQVDVEETAVVDQQDEADREDQVAVEPSQNAVVAVASVPESPEPLVQNQANVNVVPNPLGNLRRSTRLKRAREEKEEAEAAAAKKPKAQKENKRPMKRRRRT